MNKENLAKEYLTNIRQYDKLKRSNEKLVGEVRSRDIDIATTLLRSSLIFNDHTFLSAIGDGELTMTILDKTGAENYLGTSEVLFHIPSRELENKNIKKENLQCSPGFLSGASKQFYDFISEIEPFLESKKVIYEPERMAIISDVAVKAPQHFHALNVSQESPWDLWSAIEESKEKTSIALVSSTSSFKGEKLLFDIIIPFIQGLSFKDLHEIIEDEQDSLILFRKKLKEVVSSAQKNSQALIELINDELNPQLALLNNRFKKIVDSHRLRVGGVSLGTCALSLFSIFSPELLPVVTTLLGAGGAGLITKEYANYVEQLHKMKENPYYFLWKIRKKS